MHVIEFRPWFPINATLGNFIESAPNAYGTFYRARIVQETTRHAPWDIEITLWHRDTYGDTYQDLAYGRVLTQIAPTDTALEANSISLNVETVQSGFRLGDF